MVLNHEKLKELEDSMGNKIEDLTEKERESFNPLIKPKNQGLKWMQHSKFNLMNYYKN